jgi:hypothetical protein
VEVAREWRRLHNEELRYLYASRNTIRVIKSMMGWERHVARMGKMRNAYNILVGKPGRKKPLARSRRRWKVILHLITGNSVGRGGLDACGSV